MTIFNATAAMLLLGGISVPADLTISVGRHGVAEQDLVAARSAQNAPANPPSVTITLVRWPFT